MGRCVQVAAGVNGPLLAMLAESAQWLDEACVELFRQGAPLFGVLEKSGVGVPKTTPDDASPESILVNIEERSAKVRVTVCAC